MSLGWNSMPIFFSLSARRFMSSCRIIQSSWFFIFLYKMQSSANNLVHDWAPSGRTLVNNKKSRGPRTVPGGSPLMTWLLSDLEPKPKPAVSGLSGRPLSSCE